jgi:uncharacterized protein (TIGR03083 family)
MTTEAKPSRVNVMEYAGKDHLLDTVRGERATFFGLIDDPSVPWDGPTACSEWLVRDVAAHLLDVTEGYLDRFELARAGRPFPDARGMRVMAQALDDGAKSFRSLSRADLVARLKSSSARLFEIFDALNEQQWAGEMVPHIFMGPLPAFCFAAFQLIDYSIHSWDITQGLGRPDRLTDGAATTLIPFMFIVLQNTLDQKPDSPQSCSTGIQIGGQGGGSWRVNVAGDAVTYADGPTDSCGAVFTFEDPHEFVLTVYQRIRGGQASGDQAVADAFRNLFFKI